MKKLKKSVIAIIVSIVSVIAVAGIIIGVVFATRKPKEKPLTPLEILSIDINQKHEDLNVDFYDDAPFAQIDGCTIDDIVEFGDNYFIYQSHTLNEIVYERFVTYKSKGERAFELRDLTNRNPETSSQFKAYGNGFVSANEYRIFTHSDKYVVIGSITSEGDFGDTIVYPEATYSVVYFGGDEPVEVLSFKEDEQNGILTGAEEIVGNYLYLEFAKPLNGGIDYVDINSYVYKLPEKASDELQPIYASSSKNVEMIIGISSVGTFPHTLFYNKIIDFMKSHVIIELKAEAFWGLH